MKKGKYRKESGLVKQQFCLNRVIQARGVSQGLAGGTGNFGRRVLRRQRLRHIESVFLRPFGSPGKDIKDAVLSCATLPFLLAMNPGLSLFLPP